MKVDWKFKVYSAFIRRCNAGRFNKDYDPDKAIRIFERYEPQLILAEQEYRSYCNEDI